MLSMRKEGQSLVSVWSKLLEQLRNKRQNEPDQSEQYQIRR
jgi:hypothetical protein